MHLSKDSYLWGRCALFATALKNITGWHIYAISEKHSDQYSHFFVINPSNNKAYDAAGIRSFEDIAEYYEISEYYLDKIEHKFSGNFTEEELNLATDDVYEVFPDLKNKISILTKE